MTAASAGNDGDLRFGGIGTKVDDLVLWVEGGGGVGFGDGGEGGEDEVGGVVYEVFGCILLDWSSVGTDSWSQGTLHDMLGRRVSPLAN